MNTSQPQMYNLPDSDLELLSGYIDNRLGGSEQATLERRLGADPRLRAELEDLRATTTLLRELDPLPLPRSFTLDRATAPRRRSFLSLAWVMQLGGGLAGLALVLMASLQMLSGMAAPSAAMIVSTEATQAPAATQAPTMMVAAAAPMAAATAAPLVAAAVAPANTSAPMSDAARQSGSARESTTNVNSSPGELGVTAGAAAPSANIAAGGSSSPDTQSLATPASLVAIKDVPQRAEFPAGLSLGLGVVLLALAIGSFFFTRSHR